MYVQITVQIEAIVTKGQAAEDWRDQHGQAPTVALGPTLTAVTVMTDLPGVACCCYHSIMPDCTAASMEVHMAAAAGGDG